MHAWPVGVHVFPTDRSEYIRNSPELFHYTRSNELKAQRVTQPSIDRPKSFENESKKELEVLRDLEEELENDERKTSVKLPDQLQMNNEVGKIGANEEHSKALQPHGLHQNAFSLSPAASKEPDTPKASSGTGKPLKMKNTTSKAQKKISKNDEQKENATSSNYKNSDKALGEKSNQSLISMGNQVVEELKNFPKGPDALKQYKIEKQQIIQRKHDELEKEIVEMRKGIKPEMFMEKTQKFYINTSTPIPIWQRMIKAEKLANEMANKKEKMMRDEFELWKKQQSPCFKAAKTPLQ